MTGALPRYVALATLRGCLLMAFILFGVGGIVDMIERFRDLSGKTGLDPATIAFIAFARLPKLVETAAPFVVFLGAVWAFAHLVRRSEVIVGRASGLPIWRLATPAALAAAAVGACVTGFLNPAASALQGRAETLIAEATGEARGLVAVQDAGFWLLDGTDVSRTIIHARQASDGGVRLADVSFQLFEPDGNFRARIDGPRAHLADGEWIIEDARLIGIGVGARRYASFKLPTRLGPEDLQAGVAGADVLSYWALPSFIRRADLAGFATQEHVYVWHKLTAAPLMFAAVAYLAGAICAARPRGPQRGAVIAATTLSTGFGLYFLATLAEALGRSGAAPAALAAWAPPAGALLLAIGAVLHADDA